MAAFDEMRKTGYGIGFHWTTWTAAQAGPELTFPEAVERFDVNAFVDQARAAGAGHVLFTLTHELQWLPCPHPVIDKLLPGRTCQRDLPGELADALGRHDIRLILYYHHGCDLPTQDPAWQDAVGGSDKDPQRLFSNIQRILVPLGQRYGKRVIGWWFDGGWALDRRKGVPWEALTAAAKAGHSDRAVTYNPGLGAMRSLTPLEDYYAGEREGLEFVPNGPTAPGGLPWYSFTTWHTTGAPQARWGISADTHDAQHNHPEPRAVADYILAYQRAGGCVTLNLLCYQNGQAHPDDLAVMRSAKALLRPT